MRTIQITGKLARDLLTEGCETPPFRVRCGLPKGCRLYSAEVDDHTGFLVLRFDDGREEEVETGIKVETYGDKD